MRVRAEVGTMLAVSAGFLLGLSCTDVTPAEPASTQAGAQFASVQQACPGVVVSPTEAELEVGETEQFQAKVYHHRQCREMPNWDAEWSASGGSISEDGLYTATEPGEWLVIASRKQGDAAADTATVRVTGEADPEPDPDPEPEEPVVRLIHTDAERGNVEPLDGATLSGDAYVALEVPEPDPDSVIFWLDGERAKKESLRPYDFRADTDGAPNPWPTTEIENGPHEMLAAAYWPEVADSARAAFVVDNPVPGPGVSDADSARIFPGHAAIEEGETVTYRAVYWWADAAYICTGVWTEAEPSTGAFPWSPIAGGETDADCRLRWCSTDNRVATIRSADEPDAEPEECEP